MSITLDIEIGDTILMGKFKNKRVVVKTIGKNDLGLPTVNGKPIVSFRYAPQQKENKMKDLKLKNILNEAISHEDRINEIIRYLTVENRRHVEKISHDLMSSIQKTESIAHSASIETDYSIDTIIKLLGMFETKIKDIDTSYEKILAKLIPELKRLRDNTK